MAAQTNAGGASAAATPIGTAMARFIAGTRQRAYDPKVVDYARRALGDWMGVALGAVNGPPAIAVRKVALALGGSGTAQILFGGGSTPALAALINGTMAHVMDYDDSHKDHGGHISGPTWATAFAMATHHDLGEREALSSYITGFEVQSRMGAGEVDNALRFRAWHPTSVLAKCSAAAVASAMLGLDEARTAHALGVAATVAGGSTPPSAPSRSCSTSETVGDHQETRIARHNSLCAYRVDSEAHHWS